MQEINLSDITFVIPTKRKYIHILKSISPECKINIQRESTRGEARNVGIMKANTNYIVFADDDIEFSNLFFDYVISLLDDRTIVGLQAYYPSPFLISRFMIFHKNIWDDVGNLPNWQHGEETEWLIRAWKKGYKILGVPRESIKHIEHPVSKYKKEYLNLIKLLYLHPTFLIMIIKSILYKMKNSNYIDDKTLPY